MTESTTFHFTLGPVQGFVAQARRTRDFGLVHFYYRG